MVSNTRTSDKGRPLGSAYEVVSVRCNRPLTKAAKLIILDTDQTRKRPANIACRTRLGLLPEKLT